ncbi:hypothetical protein [Alistipes senegalensis]|uniref:hypothetical protein n=1 Tax=Alistipes senegalensis TaxID=1288121 RepID=UPI0018A8D9D8|nr:hypothetical protein [Alistipes senegalensis]
MKSQKAKESIERYRRTFSAPYQANETAEYCRLFKEIAEIAEQEAEERMRQKSIKAFEDVLYMPAKQLAEECGVSIDRVREDAGIDYCRQLFIQKLSEK